MIHGMRIILIFALIFIEQCFISAQEITDKNIKIGFTGGFGTYIQSDLKKLNESVMSKSVYKPEMINDFPGNFFLGGYALVKVKPGFYVGPSYQFHSTGSRVGKKDYSGFYRFDNILSCHSVGIQIEKSITNGGKLVLSGGGIFGTNISLWEMSEELMIGDQSRESTTKFKALRPFIYPELKLEYPLIFSLNISLSAGYSFDLFGKYKTDVVTSDLVAKWTGPRANLSLAYSF